MANPIQVNNPKLNEHLIYDGKNFVNKPYFQSGFFNRSLWNDWMIPFAYARVPAANAPTWTPFVGNLNRFTFGINDLLEVDSETLHGYSESSGAFWHIHWATNGIDGTARQVNWEIEYTIANAEDAVIGDVFPAPTIINLEATIPANTPDRSHIFTGIGEIDMTGIVIGAYIVARVRRIAAAGTDPSNDPFGIAVGIHQLNNSLGSRQEFIK